MDKERTNKQNFSTHPRFVPWPPGLLEKIKNGDPTPEDPVLIATYFNLYLSKHFADYRAFMVRCVKALRSEFQEWKKKDLPPFLLQLFDEVEKIKEGKNGR